MPLRATLRTVDRSIKWLDHYQRKHRLAGFLYAVLKKYSEDEAGHTAALLAYYGFLSLFPLLLVATTLLKLLLRNNSHISGQIVHGAVAYFPTIGHDLQQNIHGIGTSGIALVVGIGLTLFGARGVADVLRGGLDHIWQVPQAERSAFPGSLARSMSIIVVGGLGLLLAPVVSGYAFIFGHDSTFFRPLSVLLTAFVLFWVLIFVIEMGGSTRRPLRDVWVGAALAAASLEVLQILGSYLVARELQHLDNLYGTFALVLGLLYWVYLQAQVLLYVFELDSVRVLKLWPRSIHRPLTAADHEAYQLYADRARFQDKES